MDLLDDDRLLDLRPRARRTDAGQVVAEERERARQSPVPAANEALRTWDGPTPEPAATAAVSGLCAVCGAKPARSLCRNCGKGACGPHLWALLGLCKACAPSGRA